MNDIISDEMRQRAEAAAIDATSLASIAASLARIENLLALIASALGK
jgi:hypothetical protein